LIDEEKERAAMGPADQLKPPEELDLTKFVELLNYNRRWTYQGSLTTAPCSEGILWNVIEHVIPISQSTMDEFIKLRKVQEDVKTHPTIEGCPTLDERFQKAIEDHPA
jgi:carbonic anhydrase